MIMSLKAAISLAAPDTSKQDTNYQSVKLALCTSQGPLSKASVSSSVEK